MKKIDFVIPAHLKDFESLALSVAGIKKNISCAGQIFIVSSTDPKIEGTTYCNELFAYEGLVDISKIEDAYKTNNPALAHRASWIYQQMLKLLVHRAVQDLSESYVLVDADTIFVRDVAYDPDLFFYNKEPVYPHYLPSTIALLGNTIDFGAIAHQMICTKTKMEEMVSGIESKFGCSLVDAVLQVIDYHQASNISEQDLWATFMLFNYPELSQERPVVWADIPFVPDQQYLNQAGQNLDFVSCHAWMR
jgi:hypothetical protein